MKTFYKWCSKNELFVGEKSRFRNCSWMELYLQYTIVSIIGSLHYQAHFQYMIISTWLISQKQHCTELSSFLFSLPHMVELVHDSHTVLQSLESSDHMRHTTVCDKSNSPSFINNKRRAPVGNARNIWGTPELYTCSFIMNVIKQLGFTYHTLCEAYY